MDLLNNLLGTSFSNAVSLAIMFAILLVILLLVVWLIKKLFGNRIPGVKKSRQPRLSVTDAAIVDEKRRLVLVRRDDIEHLVMIGGPSDVVIEQNIQRLRPVVVPTSNRAPIEQPQEAPVREETPLAAPAAIGAATAAVASTASSGLESVSNVGTSAVSSLASAGSAATDKVSDIGSNIVEKASATTSAIKEQADETVEVVSDKIDSSLDAPIETKSAQAPTISTNNNEIEDDMQSLLDELANEKKI